MPLQQIGENSLAPCQPSVAINLLNAARRALFFQNRFPRPRRNGACKRSMDSSQKARGPIAAAVVDDPGLALGHFHRTAAVEFDRRPGNAPARKFLRTDGEV